MLFYRVNSLPDMILLGKQTETGVQEIGFDCTAWLSRWPGLAISILVTPPGSAEAYPADTHMEGNTCVWTVNGSDTAKAGNGCMEIVGLADGLKKLSMTCGTRVISTHTDTTSEPPEAAQPWVDKVLAAAAQAEGAREAADRVEAAADRVEAAVEDLQDGVLDYNSLLNKPCGSEASVTQNLFYYGVSFTDKVYAITAPFAGPLIVGGKYNIGVKNYGSSSWTNYTCTARAIEYNGASYIAVGNVGGLDGESPEYTATSEPVVFLMNPDNKPDADGVYGKIVHVRDTLTAPTITLYGSYETVIKLPEKYLPDNLPTSGGVSSWNDLTDKPFYKHEGDAFVLPETAVVLDVESGQGGLSNPLNGKLVVGETYAVVWNGATYRCTAQTSDALGMPATVLGDIGLMTGGDSTGEPFVFVEVPDAAVTEMGAYAMFVALDGSTSATVSIYGYTVFTKTLDEEYLPQDVPFIFVVNVEGIQNTASDVSTWKADKTYEQTKQAIESGRLVYLRVFWDASNELSIMPCFGINGTSGGLLFSHPNLGGEPVEVAFTRNETFSVY